jgi:hypothetical protein
MSHRLDIENIPFFQWMIEVLRIPEHPIHICHAGNGPFFQWLVKEFGTSKHRRHIRDIGNIPIF